MEFTGELTDLIGNDVPRLFPELIGLINLTVVSSGNVLPMFEKVRLCNSRGRVFVYGYVGLSLSRAFENGCVMFPQEQSPDAGAARFLVTALSSTTPVNINRNFLRRSRFTAAVELWLWRCRHRLATRSFMYTPTSDLRRCWCAQVLQDRGLNLLQSQGIQVLLGNIASEVTKDEVLMYSFFALSAAVVTFRSSFLLWREQQHTTQSCSRPGSVCEESPFV